MWANEKFSVKTNRSVECKLGSVARGSQSTEISVLFRPTDQADPRSFFIRMSPAEALQFGRLLIEYGSI